MLLYSIVEAIFLYIVWYLIVTIPFHFIDKGAYSIAKFLNEILDFGKVDLRFGVVPRIRVIVNYAKMVIVWFTAGITITDKGNVSLITFSIALIIGILIKKITIPYVINHSAKKYINDKLQKNEPFSEKEFLNIKKVDRCQRWSMKVKGEIVLYFAQNTLQKAVAEKLVETLNATVKEDRIYLYKEYSIFIPYLEEKGLQMNIFLSDNYITVGDAGFFSRNIYYVLKEKISAVIDTMASIFSLQQAFEGCTDSEEMNKYLPKNISVTIDEKNTLYSPVIHHELEDLEKKHQISKVPEIKENGPILYKKIKPGLVNEKGIYKGEPDFEGPGCQDCGVHTMPEDDEEDEL